MPDTTTTSLNEQFRRLLTGLNPAQHLAVELTEGPVLVLAGPGTGKTHVLAARIGKILLETDIPSSAILCLTFTDSGVLAMRNRLLGMIGPEAHRIPIYTFHAFCHRIIQENPVYFGKTGLEPLSELERIDIIRNILESLLPEHPLRSGKKDAYAFEKHLRNLFDLMKKEAWSPGFLIRQADAFIRDLPDNPQYQYQRNYKGHKVGDPKQGQIEQVHQKMILLKAAADLFPKYSRELDRLARYEYEDMIQWVLRAFKENTSLLRNYQERYLYFMVDEFQDTNGAQNELLQLLLNYWESPNVFIVGDDDQSIFEFQGARLQNLVDFYQKHRDVAQLVVLEDNYRSPQGILDAAGQLIGHNRLRAVNLLEVGLRKNLKAHNLLDKAPVLHVYENRIQEIAGLVGQIEALQHAGVPLHDIAVLYPQHKQADSLLALLQYKNIPFQTKRPVNVLDTPLILQIRRILHWLQEESEAPLSGDHRLFTLLHAPFWELPQLDLARLAAYNRLRTEGPKNWRELLDDQELLETLGHRAPIARWNTVRNTLEQWIADTINLPPAALLEKIYLDAGISRYALHHPDKAWLLQTLQTFMQFVRNESERNPGLNLKKLLQVLNSMEANRLPVALQQTIRTGDGVHLLSVHAAKGLEFPHVFMLDTTENYWEPGTRGNQNMFAFPDTLTHAGEEDAVEARRRLFYVAMTRAGHSLIISYSRFNDAGKPLAPARFVHEAGLRPETVNLPEEKTIDALAGMLGNTLPDVSLPEPHLLEALLQTFELTISALNRYLRCPLAFYYVDLLGIPELPSPAASYGQAMHQAVQVFFNTMKTKDGQWPMEAVLLDAYTDALTRRKGAMSHAEFIQRKAFGLNALSKYFHRQIPVWRKKAVVERRIERLEIEGVPVKGVIDKIEWTDRDALRIVDYKTGAADNAKAAQPSPEQPNGGAYWRQLGFYTLLLEKSGIYPQPVASAAIEWLEPDAKDRFPATELTFTRAELAMIAQMIRSVWEKIQNKAFDTGCGEKDCVWCQIHYHGRPITPYPREEELLDDNA